MQRPALVVDNHEDSWRLIEDLLGVAKVPTINAHDGLT
jgi:hypothetical protein